MRSEFLPQGTLSYATAVAMQATGGAAARRRDLRIGIELPRRSVGSLHVYYLSLERSWALTSQLSCIPELGKLFGSGNNYLPYAGLLVRC